MAYLHSRPYSNYDVHGNRYRPLGWNPTQIDQPHRSSHSHSGGQFAHLGPNDNFPNFLEPVRHHYRSQSPLDVESRVPSRPDSRAPSRADSRASSRAESVAPSESSSKNYDEYPANDVSYMNQHTYRHPQLPVPSIGSMYPPCDTGAISLNESDDDFPPNVTLPARPPGPRIGRGGSFPSKRLSSTSGSDSRASTPSETSSRQSHSSSTPSLPTSTSFNSSTPFNPSMLSQLLAPTPFLPLSDMSTQPTNYIHLFQYLLTIPQECLGYTLNAMKLMAEAHGRESALLKWLIERNGPVNRPENMGSTSSSCNIPAPTSSRPSPPDVNLVNLTFEGLEEWASRLPIANIERPAEFSERVLWYREDAVLAKCSYVNNLSKFLPWKVILLKDGGALELRKRAALESSVERLAITMYKKLSPSAMTHAKRGKTYLRKYHLRAYEGSLAIIEAICPETGYCADHYKAESLLQHALDVVRSRDKQSALDFPIYDDVPGSLEPPPGLELPSDKGKGKSRATTNAPVPVPPPHRQPSKPPSRGSRPPAAAHVPVSPRPSTSSRLTPRKATKRKNDVLTPLKTQPKRSKPPGTLHMSPARADGSNLPRVTGIEPALPDTPNPPTDDDMLAGHSTEADLGDIESNSPDDIPSAAEVDELDPDQDMHPPPSPPPLPLIPAPSPPTVSSSTTLPDHGIAWISVKSSPADLQKYLSNALQKQNSTPHDTIAAAAELVNVMGRYRFFQRSEPSERVLQLVKRMLLTSPDEVDEDNTNQQWGHYQYTAGDLTINTVITSWAAVGSVDTAFDLLAAGLRICECARHICFDNGIRLEPNQKLLADNYLGNLMNKLVSVWQAAHGPLDGFTARFISTSLLTPSSSSAPALPVATAASSSDQPRVITPTTTGAGSNTEGSHAPQTDKAVLMLLTIPQLKELITASQLPAAKSGLKKDALADHILAIPNHSAAVDAAKALISATAAANPTKGRSRKAQKA